MIIDLRELNTSKDFISNIEIDYSFSDEELKDTDIIKLDNLKITGDINKRMDTFYINISAKGVMVLPSSISLKPVDYSFSFEIEGDINEIYEELGQNLKKNANSLDIFPIIWENILMEIPIRITNEGESLNENLSGSYSLVDEDEKATNPELEKLRQLL